MRAAILTNGPGELWGWVRPVTAELKRRGHSVSLWLLPCPFASGHEYDAARLLEAYGVRIDKISSAGAAGLWRDMAREHADCVLQLGGDIIFGSHISKAAKAPLFCYTYGPRKTANGVRVFTAFESQARLIPGAEAIGDLVKDALSMDSREPSAAWEGQRGSMMCPRVLFLPGSRPAIRARALTWLSEVKSVLIREIPNIQIRTLFPIFAPEAETEAWSDAGLSPIARGAGAVMPDADFALTQPGTNTLELMHCGLPGLVVAPESFLDLVPVAGISGMIASLPVVGRAIRRAASLRLIKRWGGFISLPNRTAGRAVLDERFGDVTPREAAGIILSRLGDPETLSRMRAELLSMSGESGAASRLCDKMEAAA